MWARARQLHVLDRVLDSGARSRSEVEAARLAALPF